MHPIKSTWRSRLRSMLRHVCLLVALYGPALIFWFSTASVAFAKKSRNATPVGPPTKDYVFCYFLVLVCVSLGLMMICRPTYRSFEPPFQKTEE